MIKLRPFLFFYYYNFDLFKLTKKRTLRERDDRFYFFISYFFYFSIFYYFSIIFIFLLFLFFYYFSIIFLLFLFFYYFSIIIIFLIKLILLQLDYKINMNTELKSVSWDLKVKFRIIPNRDDLEKDKVWWSLKDLHFFKIKEMVRKQYLY